MNRPIVVGVADGPHNPASETLSRADFVLFAEWPETFEPERLGGVCLPKNWRYAPLAICSEIASGKKVLPGLVVLWGKDDAVLASAINNAGYKNGLVVVTSGGSGLAVKAAKRAGYHIERMSSGRLSTISCLNGTTESIIVGGSKDEKSTPKEQEPTIKVKPESSKSETTAKRAPVKKSSKQEKKEAKSDDN